MSTETPNSSPSSQMYHPVPKDDSHNSVPDVINTEERLHVETRGGSPWTGVVETDTSSLAGSHVSSRNGGGGSRESPSPLHLAVATSNSFDLGSGDDWEDDDDDEANVRRYHLDFAHTLPVEFSHNSLWKRIWASFLDLRMKARQRRAARLLTMPNEHFIYRLHACLLTWCCDATDRGILLAACCIVAWVLIGVTFHLSSTWWWAGIVLFVVRISARRVVEGAFRTKRRQQRYHHASAESMQFGNAEPWHDATPRNSDVA